jgi:amidase
MKRRQFVTSTVLGSTALTIGGITSCVSRAKDVPGTSVNFTDFELNEFTISMLQEKMTSGELTASGICRKYLDRIQTVDPFLRSVIEINPDAQQMAERLDEERKAGKIRGPLHGIPILIKDNIDTADKMQTTAGSLAFSGNIAPEDAPIVAKLREAGAVLIGKTNLSEWANFRSEMSSSGWSGRGGQVRNPYCFDRSPCGSSSGTGAAISANLCAIGIGTETNGSIVCPSGVNGIVGIKPTLGLWNGKGIVPIAHSQDTAGPMCRTVTDAAILLGALAEAGNTIAPKEGATGKILKDYNEFLDTEGLSSMRLGVFREVLGFHPQVDELFSQAVELMKSKGAVIVDPVNFEGRKTMGDASYQVLLYEFKADLNKYISEHPLVTVRSLEEIIAFNESNQQKEMPWFGQDIFKLAQKKGDLTSGEYLKALAESKRLAQTDGIDKVMKEHQLDAIIAPTNGPAWTIDWVNGDHFSGSSSSYPAIAGYPNITVPMGFLRGLPVGISFFGKAWSESTLIKIAFAFEQASKHRKPPGFEETMKG